MDYRLLGEQINDALDEFVEEDKVNRATAVVIWDVKRDKGGADLMCSGNGFPDNLENALANLLVNVADHMDDPEGFLANLFIRMFRYLKHEEKQ